MVSASSQRAGREMGSIMIDTGKPEVLFVLFMLASCRLEHLMFSTLLIGQLMMLVSVDKVSSLQLKLST